MYEKVTASTQSGRVLNGYLSCVNVRFEFVFEASHVRIPASICVIVVVVIIIIIIILTEVAFVLVIR